MPDKCDCACHPGQFKGNVGGYTVGLENGSSNSVIGCCWWNHLTEEQKNDVNFLLWKCYKFMKFASTSDLAGEKFFGPLYQLVADRVHEADFPEMPC